MLTNNYYQLIKSAMMYNPDSGYKEQLPRVIDINGVERIAYAPDSAVFSVYSYQHNTMGSYVLIGTGTTPPTLTDYALSGSKITTFTSTKSNLYAEDLSWVKHQYTITNTGSTPITIGEIAFVKTVSCLSGTSTKSYSVLLERTLLETPLTLEPLGIGQITYMFTPDFSAFPTATATTE